MRSCSPIILHRVVVQPELVERPAHQVGDVRLIVDGHTDERLLHLHLQLQLARVDAHVAAGVLAVVEAQVDGRPLALDAVQPHHRLRVLAVRLLVAVRRVQIGDVELGRLAADVQRAQGGAEQLLDGAGARHGDGAEDAPPQRVVAVEDFDGLCGCDMGESRYHIETMSLQVGGNCVLVYLHMFARRRYFFAAFATKNTNASVEMKSHLDLRMGWVAKSADWTRGCKLRFNWIFYCISSASAHHHINFLDYAGHRPFYRHIAYCI